MLLPQCNMLSIVIHLQDYLKRYRYANAKTYQLWQSINEAVQKSSTEAVAKIDVELIMDTWTKQQGFPLITIEFNRVTNVITASQQRMKNVQDTSVWPDSPYKYV